MTHRENIIAARGDGVPSWVPVIGHVDAYNRPTDVGLPAEIAAAADEHGWWSGHAGIAYARLLDITVAAWTQPPLRIEQTACDVETVENGRDTVRTYRTKLGDLREVIRRADSGAASYRIEHVLKSPDDLPLLAELSAGERMTIDEEAAAMVSCRAKETGDAGVLITPMPGTPLGMLIRIYAGPETTAYLHADAPAELTGLFSFGIQHRQLGENPRP